MISGEVAPARAETAVSASWRGRRPPARQLAEALLRGDVDDASDLAHRFLARVGSRVAVFADLLQPALHQVGDLWYRGRIGIDDEHRAAVTLDGVVERLPATPSASQVPAGCRCLLTVIPGERHTLGLAMLALAFEDDGWEVELVDPECSPMDIPDLVERIRPRLVAISATYLPSAQVLAQVIGGTRRLSVPVLVGGAAFNRSGDLWRRVGASAWGADVRIGTVLARRLTRS